METSVPSFPPLPKKVRKKNTNQSVPVSFHDFWLTSSIVRPLPPALTPVCYVILLLPFRGGQVILALFALGEFPPSPVSLYDLMGTVQLFFN